MEKSGIILRWLARLSGIVSGLVLLVFAFGGRESIRMTAVEAVGFLFFPLGVIAGFVVAWRRDLTGGLITIGSLAVFFVWLALRDGRLGGSPYFLLFAAPGFLHVASALCSRAHSRSAGARAPEPE